jgi:hypothetical protein
MTGASASQNPIACSQIQNVCDRMGSRVVKLLDLKSQWLAEEDGPAKEMLPWCECEWSDEVRNDHLQREFEEV